MKISEFKITKKILKKALKDQKPSRKIIEKGILEHKKIIITKHALQRLEERLFHVVNFLELAKYITFNFPKIYFSSTIKKIDDFIIKMNFGKIPLNLYFSHDLEKDYYILKTMFLDMNEDIFNLITKNFRDEENEKWLSENIKDHFFNGISEEDYFQNFGDFKYIHKNSYKKFLNSDKTILFDDYDKEKIFEEAESFCVDGKK